MQIAAQRYFSTSAAKLTLAQAAMLAGIVENPSQYNPLGTKGCGEAGAIGSPPAVINAVLDALRDLGVQDLDMPASPGRVWARLRPR